MENKEVRRLNLLILKEEFDSWEKLAAMIQSKASYLSQIASPKITKVNMGDRIARKLEVACSKDIGWMDIPHDTVIENTRSGPRIQKAVPIISYVQAGNWEEISEFRDAGDEEPPVYTTEPVSRSAYALIVQGDSMLNPHGAPTYAPGSIIVVDPLLPEEPGRRVVYRLQPQGAATFKQLETDGFKFWLKPLNPRYDIIELTEDAKYCGTVVQSWNVEK
jgi:SOS-response transcriptional repressor LexA